MTYRAETLPAALTKSLSLSTRPIIGAPEATAAATITSNSNGPHSSFFARLFRFQPPALTVSDELNEVQHRLVQIDSVKHDRFKISVLEGPHQPDCDHSFPGHLPPDPRYRTGRCPLDEARFLREYRGFLRLRSRDDHGPSESRSLRRFLLRVHQKGEP